MKLDALILAGGEGRRMGGCDKGLLHLAGRPMIEHLAARLRDCTDHVWVSCRAEQADDYTGAGTGVLPDEGDSLGPLSGISRALHGLRCSHLLITPCDTPLVSIQAFRQMIEHSLAAPDKIVVVHDGDYLQTLHLIVPVAKAASLDLFRATGRRAVRGWLEQEGYVECHCDSPQEFMNINTRDALAAAQLLLEGADTGG
ncbi:molybdenum cofactor guanylyltransferase [Marinobacterium rhizophilum]|uniref:Molybdenum cofactor guanylyltransferase n=1 Tax=Marinobacterium rhizophilum TaxID=420402 RepID=A0ABY5HS29_9GAMM|nr:molybdenum cofactor guanylyltransferase [Marinobacterium rhizophilum]UTW14027.1 molybdenum cofactor guanylyltransferase [Marinobacterium rhizophilum]